MNAAKTNTPSQGNRRAGRFQMQWLPSTNHLGLTKGLWCRGGRRERAREECLYLLSPEPQQETFSGGRSLFGVGWVVRRVRPHSSGLGGKLTVPRGQMEKGTWTTPSFVPGDGQQGDPALLLSLPPSLVPGPWTYSLLRHVALVSTLS